MSLWFDTIAPVHLVTGFTLVQTGSHTNASWANPEALTLSLATSAGDCVVICYGIGGGVDPTASGLGATWTTYNSAASSPAGGLIVGYNCSAGQTAININGLTTPAGDVVWGVWSGVRSASNPVSATAHGNAGPGTSVSASPNIPAIGQLFVGGFASNTSGGTWSTPGITWGVSWTTAKTSNTNKTVAMFYQLAGGTGPTGCTSNYSSSDNLRCAALTLIPFP